MTEKSRTVGLMTVGCKLNQYETEGVAERLEERGFVVVPFDGPADVYVVNTCTVTGRSDYRSRQMLRRAARKGGGALIVATGCYAQREPDALAAMPEVNLVVGNGFKRDLAGLVVERLCSDAGGSGETRIEVRPIRNEAFEAFDIKQFRGYTRAFIKIQDGCDNRCTYCAVPGARGPARSRRFDDVLEQASLLVANGYREIVLTGVHIGAFADPDGHRLPELLRALAEIDRLVRLRLGSVEPRELTPELAATILQTVKVCNHLHVPLESGSDAVLERMGRRYTRAEYAEAVRRVTDADPLCGLGTDVMVAFPGETEEDFADTVSLIESLPYTYLHVFAFSPRSGTPAAEMDGRVPAAESKRRSLHLRELGSRLSLRFRRNLVGKSLEILVEERVGTEGSLTGLTSNYVRVGAEGDPSLRNKFVGVTVRQADETSTRGDIDPGSAR
ncbi:MAG: tRNA (N(6)-L-threonylcarbamoyladenosine(37)-C(2))-methylthiotransferase MtaB [Candidatus Eisenbacteria sp.]|nr:tRNA (N(6)-L-threonylcarbamoyladenosine(37)-C(2))-methylthiotransferase MtaB [Candidatus Eisenbacteria bacterium]